MDMDISFGVLRDCFFFSGLDESELSQIFSKLQRVDLAENEYLFKERDPGDALYILIQGKLTALTTYKLTEKVIGFVRPGEVVGELNIFSNAPRSASIKAVYSSIVLRLSREDFQSICYKNPKILWQVSHLIARRSQSNMEILREGKTSKSQLIAIVSVGQKIDIQKLLSVLKINNNKVWGIDFFDFRDVKKVSDSVESGRTLICCVDSSELNEKKDSLQLFDKVVIAVNAECNDCHSIKNVWAECIQKNIEHLDKELMLLHDEDKTSYPNTQQYFNLASFLKCYHITLQSSKMVQRVLRLLSGNAIGLVVGGGGARGWAAVGVIKALMENDIPIDYVGGSSIGSGVTGVYSLIQSYRKVLEYSQSSACLFSNPFKISNLTWPLVSIFTGKLMTRWIQKNCGEVMICDLSLPFFAVSTNLSTLSEYVWDKEYLWQAVRASASAPMLAPPFTYKNQLHVDGGVLNNFPIDVMRNKLENRGIIIGVDITRSCSDFVKYNFPPVLSLWEVLRMKIRGEPYVSIMEVMDRTMMAVSMEKTIVNSKKCDVLIRPKLDDIGLLNFAKKEEVIERGYREAREQLSKYDWLKNPSCPCDEK